MVWMENKTIGNKWQMELKGWKGNNCLMFSLAGTFIGAQMSCTDVY